MLITGEIISVREDSFKGKNGLVEQVIVSCIDTGIPPLINSFDYSLKEEEKATYGTQKALRKKINIGCHDLAVGFGGRLVAKGAIVEEK